MQERSKVFSTMTRGQASRALEHLEFMERILRHHLKENFMDVEVPSDLLREVEAQGKVKRCVMELPLDFAIDGIRFALQQAIERGKTS